jgi:predicted peroxiredoxin/TusA-related sulfurtransferase
MDRTQQEPEEIDGRGLSISTAILYEVVSALDSLDPGGEVRIRADANPALDSDIRAWTRTTGHDLIAVDEAASEHCYLLRKTDRPRSRPPWAFVISDPGLEELLSPLGFALAAALGGSPVALYFQGPATRVLTLGFTERLQGAHRAPFSGFARRGLGRSGHPPPHEKLRQLRELGARIYICAPSMEHFNVSEDELLFPEIRVAAYPTFVEEMEAAGVHVFLQ